MKYVSIDTETTGVEPGINQVIEFGAVFEDTSKLLGLGEIPSFRRFIRYNRLVGNPYALCMPNNVKTLQIISGQVKLEFDETDKSLDIAICNPDELAFQFKKWLIDKCGYETNKTIKFKEEMINSYTGFITFGVDEGTLLVKQDGVIIDVLDSIYEGKVKFLAAGKNYAGFDRRMLEEGEIKFDKEVYSHQRVIDPGTPYIDWDQDDVPPDLGTCKLRAGLDPEVSHTAVEDAWDVIQVMRYASNNYNQGGL
jgi:hypothetical protein